MALTLTELCRRTGLSARALRFYEARGLLAPGRLRNGHRSYTAADAARLAHIIALKRAGFPLARIAELLRRMPPDLAPLLDAQIAALDAERRELETALAALTAARTELARGTPLSLEALCTLIKQGGRTMTEQDWQKAVDQHFSPEDQARWRETMNQLPADFSTEDYGAKWADLTARIEAALPLDPASPAAQAFLDEWNALLAPFNNVATPKMKQEVVAFYESMPQWSLDTPRPLSTAAWEFAKAASAARRAA